MGHIILVSVTFFDLSWSEIFNSRPILVGSKGTTKYILAIDRSPTDPDHCDRFSIDINYHWTITTKTIKNDRPLMIPNNSGQQYTVYTFDDLEPKD